MFKEDKNNDNIHIENISNILKKYEVKKVVSYEISPDEIIFENGSSIKILKIKEGCETVRSKRSKEFMYLD